MATPEQPATTPAIGSPQPPEPNMIVVVIGGSLPRAEVPLLCDRVRALLDASGIDLVRYDVGALVDPDVDTLDAMARLTLTARRLGCQVEMLHAAAELRELLAFAGLADIVPCSAGSPLEPRR